MTGGSVKHDAFARTLEILGGLVAFESLSGRSNLDLIAYVTNLLDGHNIGHALSTDETGLRANLVATIGPERDGGIILCGHTDVVPTDGQDWTLPPFELTARDDRYYGRGTVDMKGFLACCLAMIPEFLSAGLQRPVHIALSFDEETGSIGAPILADQINALPNRPAAIIVGEPTDMKMIAGHKGGYEMTTRFKGVAGHSSDPRRGVNAIHYAARFIGFLESLGLEMAAEPHGETPFDPPQGTVNVGTIKGGAGRSILAEDCQLEWELRTTPPDNGEHRMVRIRSFLSDLKAEMRADFPDASIETETVSHYPGLAYNEDSDALDIVRRISGENAVYAVPFGTDAGCFDRANLSAIVFGPGSIHQAHKPDEFIDGSQIRACLSFLDDLARWQARPGKVL